MEACHATTDSGGTGTLNVSMTDAPACGFDNVWVTVAKVRAHQSDSASIRVATTRFGLVRGSFAEPACWPVPLLRDGPPHPASLREIRQIKTMRNKRL